MLLFLEGTISLYRGVVLIRIIALIAVCSSCCNRGSRCASILIVALVVVWKALVMICAARL